jgi:hypothetical protein
MQYSKRWTGITYLFKTRRLSRQQEGLETLTLPDPVKTGRRRRIEEHMEQRALGRELADVWE